MAARPPLAESDPLQLPAAQGFCRYEASRSEGKEPERRFQARERSRNQIRLPLRMATDHGHPQPPQASQTPHGRCNGL